MLAGLLLTTFLAVVAPKWPISAVMSAASLALVLPFCLRSPWTARLPTVGKVLLSLMVVGALGTYLARQTLARYVSDTHLQMVADHNEAEIVSSELASASIKQAGNTSRDRLSSARHTFNRSQSEDLLSPDALRSTNSNSVSSFLENNLTGNQTPSVPPTVLTQPPQSTFPAKPTPAPSPTPAPLPAYASPSNTVNVERQRQMIAALASLRSLVKTSRIYYVNGDGLSNMDAQFLARIFQRAGLNPNLLDQNPTGPDETGLILEVRSDTPKDLPNKIKATFNVAGLAIKIVERPGQIGIPLVIFVAPAPL